MPRLKLAIGPEELERAAWLFAEKQMPNYTAVASDLTKSTCTVEVEMIPKDDDAFRFHCEA